MWLGVRVCVQNTPTYNSLTATTHPRGFTFVSAFGTAALPTLDRSDPRDLPFDHTVTDFLNFHPEIIGFFFNVGLNGSPARLYLLEVFLLCLEFLLDTESSCLDEVAPTRLDVDAVA